MAFKYKMVITCKIKVHLIFFFKSVMFPKEKKGIIALAKLDLIQDLIFLLINT